MQAKRPPAKPPAYIVLGNEQEAVAYVLDNLAAWSATPGAIEWLGAAQHDLPLAPE